MSKMFLSNTILVSVVVKCVQIMNTGVLLLCNVVFVFSSEFIHCRDAVNVYIFID